MKKHLLTATAILFLANTVYAVSPECKQSKIKNTEIEMCLERGGNFQHDVYTLKADKVTIFSLVDDYAENVSLTHTIPEGLAIEFPLSKQSEKTVSITGGCIPVSKDQIEIARVCNFAWGKYPVVKDVRFNFN